MTSTVPVSTFLRRVLLADAVLSAATGAAMALGAGLLGPLLGLPVPMLQAAGAICLAWAAIVGACGTRTTLPRLAVLAVIGLNALWVLESIALLLSGWVAPSALGIAFVLFQAAVVAVLAELQFVGLRRLNPPARVSA